MQKSRQQTYQLERIFTNNITTTSNCIRNYNYNLHSYICYMSYITPSP